VDVIRLHALTKRYDGTRGVTGLDLAVARGEIFGYLGPNGAGKTTTIRLLLDFLRPTSGRAEIFGLDPRRDAVAIRRRLGFVPGDVRLYERLTARELTDFAARVRGVDTHTERDALARRFELDLDRPIRELSRGNKQKVALVQAFAHRPELLVLDEPTSGLDPLMQQEFLALLRETADAGRTVFLSSHDLAEVQQIAERVAVLREGELVLVDTVERLRSRALTRVEATFASAPPPSAFAGIRGVHELERHGNAVLFALDGSADALVKALARFEVLTLDSREADLEDVFLTLYGREHRAA